MKVAVYGLQWGDEGKGKVVSYLSKDFDWIVRYSGGPNAGHTIVKEGIKLVHHHLPCIDHGGSNRGYLGPGMVVDLSTLIEELESLERIFPGISKRFYIDKYVSLILPWHKLEESALEKAENIGTTKRGIGPTYKDRTARFSITLYDIENDTAFEKLKAMKAIKSPLVNSFLDEAALLKDLETLYNRLLELGVKVTDFVSIKEDLEKSSILFEGSQGFLLDINCGTYPYVTSAQVASAGISSFFSWVKIDRYIGVAKAYTTRVGEGPFPTEIKGEIAQKLRERGGEYGATTGRPRRVGWLDLPALKYSVIFAPATEIVLTKADVLSGFEKIKVAISYNVKGKRVDTPRGFGDFFEAEPVYTDLAGWTDLNDPLFEEFVSLMEEFTGVKVSMVSTGPETSQMLIKEV